MSSPRHHDNWLRAYVDHTAATEAPLQFHFWTGVSTIAGALRRRVWINQNEFQWTPNFYIILVGPPGVVQKSTTTNIGATLLSKVPKITIGPASTTWQKLTSIMEGAIETTKYRNGQDVEEELQMSCVTIVPSELGTFLQLDNDQFVSVMIDLFDGKLGEWRHTTVTSSDITIRNPWINLLGCTTPAWIRKNFPENMIGGGLTSRILFIYGDTKRQLVAYPARHTSPDVYKASTKKLLDDLTVISTLVGEYKLTEEAMDWGEEWYRKLWSSRPIHMASERYDTYRARKQTMLHKLAMILVAARTNELVIRSEHLMEAATLLDSVEPDMIKVFESIGVSQQSIHIKTIMAFVKTYGWLDSNRLWSMCLPTMNDRDFKAALLSAVEAGLLLVSQRSGVNGVSINE